MTRLVGSNSKVCMTAIPLMSLPLLAGALIGLRHGAPTRPRSPAPSPGAGLGRAGGNPLCVALH